MSSDSSNYRRVGTSITNNAERQEIHRHIHRGQRTQRLLAAHGRSRIQRDIRNSENSDSFYYNSDTMSAIYPSRTSEGFTYTETGIMPTVPRPRRDRQNRRGRHQPAKSRRCARLRRQTRHSHRRRPIQRRRSGPGLSRKAQRIRLVLTWIKRRLPVNRRPRQLPHRPTARRQRPWSETVNNTPPPWH